MNVEETIEAFDLEELHVVRDRASGLRAVVAIGNRSLGPARGGTRLRAYPTFEDAMCDAARLARAMTRKFAVHGLPFGGGKAVILQDEEGAADRALLERRLLAYGAFLERLGGHFGTGPDYGIGAAEAAVIRRATGNVVGVHSHGAASEATAAGVRLALALALERTVGGGLAGKRVAIQGVGAVGAALARDLAGRGASLILADADEARAQSLAEELGAVAVTPEEILSAEADCLAPCAVGGVLSEQVITGLRCKVVAGGANDQLRAPELARARQLRERGILFVPDFVANGGAAVVLTGCGEEAATGSVQAAESGLEATIRGVLDRAVERDTTPYEAAVALANEALESGPKCR